MSARHDRLKAFVRWCDGTMESMPVEDPESRCLFSPEELAGLERMDFELSESLLRHIQLSDLLTAVLDARMVESRPGVPAWRYITQMETHAEEIAFSICSFEGLP